MNVNNANRAFTVDVDFREKTSRVYDFLEKLGATIVFKHLKIGDYVIENNVHIERKTRQDFICSILDGRLFRQAHKLKNSCNHGAIIIEGNDMFNHGDNMHPHAIQGAIISLAFIWQIPVLFSVNEEDTAYAMSFLAGQLVAHRNYQSVRPGYRPKGAYKRTLYILSGLPHVGTMTAKKMLVKFKSIKNICLASLDDLKTVPGIGKGKAAKIYSVLNQEYHV